MSENDDEPLNEIVHGICERDRGASVVDAEDARLLLCEVAKLHEVDTSAYRWWETLPHAKSVFYDHSSQMWRREFSSHLGLMGHGGFYLAVTDDEAAPWPLLWVEDSSCIIDVMEDMHFFEYFIFSKDCSKIFFDTHSNSLVASIR